MVVIEMVEGCEDGGYGNEGGEEGCKDGGYGNGVVRVLL